MHSAIARRLVMPRCASCCAIRSDPRGAMRRRAESRRLVLLRDAGRVRKAPVCAGSYVRRVCRVVIARGVPWLSFRAQGLSSSASSRLPPSAPIAHGLSPREAPRSWALSVRRERQPPSHRDALGAPSPGPGGPASLRCGQARRAARACGARRDETGRRSGTRRWSGSGASGRR